MPLKRLAIAAFIVGAGLKGLLIVIWRISRPGFLGLLLTKCDPLAHSLAERATTIFFDQKRLFPGSGEGLFFEVILVVAFGMETLLLACGAWWILRRLRGPRVATPEPPLTG